MASLRSDLRRGLGSQAHRTTTNPALVPTHHAESKDVSDGLDLSRRRSAVEHGWRSPPPCYMRTARRYRRRFVPNTTRTQTMTSLPFGVIVIFNIPIIGRKDGDDLAISAQSQGLLLDLAAIRATEPRIPPIIDRGWPLADGDIGRCHASGEAVCWQGAALGDVLGIPTLTLLQFP